MRLYIDESGDPGIRLDREGTSPHFVIAGVLVNTERDLEICSAGLVAFREANRISRDEFKFNKCDTNTRRDYLAAASRLPWRYFAVVLNKAGLSGPGFKFKNSLYKYTVSLLLQNAAPYMTDAIVVFDECRSRDFRRTMASYCKGKSRRADGVESVKRVLAQSSHSDHLLQLADMVAGAVARAYKPELPDSTTFRSLIRSREVNVQFWPK